MQAYATSERIPPGPQLRVLPTPSFLGADATAAPGQVLLDELLGRLADLVVERLTARINAASDGDQDPWLDTRRAAEYLGVHRDTMRRLGAERVIPAEQAGAGCKLFFRRSDLDRWRRSEPSDAVQAITSGRGLR